MQSLKLMGFLKLIRAVVENSVLKITISILRMREFKKGTYA
ncbi:hypothetical protein NMS_1779 [Nonlabens marinus S1-08]|uniref:Uncharacterized protein n=1 Tax=Nonlabens marinus S1-08 TaxID=1454201 RepID=W8VVV5_9FLAO|nr:hypothetical protein NMS_1779 [Nonlabens marinus S1-08]